MDTQETAEAARRMVATQIEARGIHDQRVLDAMRRMPRHRFVPQLSLADAYADAAMPTLEGQTISQPYIVALMTVLLEVQAGCRVLEIGTGSGYQTAILATLGATVVSVERSEALSRHAAVLLAELGLTKRVRLVIADGTLGYAEEAPYERILVTAGAPHVASAYRLQLADGGILVLPEGPRREQTLMVYRRRGHSWSSRSIIGCRFVPLMGQDGWRAGEQ